MLNFNSKADVLDIVESYEFVIKILDNVSDLRKNLRLLKNAKSGLFASFANDCKVEFLESAIKSKSLNNKLISCKECKGLSLLLQYSNKSVNCSLVYRFTQNKKTQMITLCKVDSNLDLESSKAKVKEMQVVLNSKDFKDSYLSLKDYLTMKKNQNDLHILEAFDMYIKSKDLRNETIANYKRMFNLHVLSYFENVKCNNVTEAFVRAWLDKLHKKIKYTDKIFILMKNIFRLLKEKKYIVRNVFLEIDYKISYKTHKYKKLDSISENDLKALLNVDFVNKKYKTHIKDTLLFKMVLFTIYTALRLKNVVMLEWKHIDFTKKILTFKGSEMKNKQDFILPLNSGALAILKEMQKCKISNFVFDRNLASHKIYISNVIKALKECKKALSDKELKRGDRRKFFCKLLRNII
ncbi:tyrosine-type recombinase/integrase [Helicobacter saguini]|uniref:Tyrosine-type recombinase/integrase n=1 Tax=Helicobacter saguini TaxID=1548018 RepID=A0A347VH30_9HELI|nr:site-specific integrase [Helicobacter saguini]MWV62129.1 tyrosine-type recombinase/integrase [Helicobacter saguini]MWV67199.1 tyrosine-type recombinase/integrase [Helicobacter saguini]MWV69551.1 tyrosine-type recombinase/integrase [Helicobacter saguini]MWV70898.1 tyrosine-type recombinase/integrase [Helicobacter saguini]TLD91465.1 hypothetical protein LS64_011985 [Helicobacter saguini]